MNTNVENALEGKMKPYLWKAALLYYMAFHAQEMSFKEMYEDVEKYVHDPQQRFRFVARIKRGMEDTSQKGGMYKDTFYFEGAVRILKQRKEIDFKLLHCGKIGIDDFQRPFINKRIKPEKCIMPCFMKNYETYLKGLDIIAETNFVDEIDEQALIELSKK